MKPLSDLERSFFESGDLLLYSPLEEEREVYLHARFISFSEEGWLLEILDQDVLYPSGTIIEAKNKEVFEDPDSPLSSERLRDFVLLRRKQIEAILKELD